MRMRQGYGCRCEEGPGWPICKPSCEPAIDPLALDYVIGGDRVLPAREPKMYVPMPQSDPLWLVLLAWCIKPGIPLAVFGVGLYYILKLC